MRPGIFRNLFKNPFCLVQSSFDVSPRSKKACGGVRVSGGLPLVVSGQPVSTPVIWRQFLLVHHPVRSDQAWGDSNRPGCVSVGDMERLDLDMKPGDGVPVRPPQPTLHRYIRIRVSLIDPVKCGIRSEYRNGYDSANQIATGHSGPGLGPLPEYPEQTRTDQGRYKPGV
ncbi:hypothetical protein RRG08_059650 [Elysia crispata]|uniref:Uncharacterized protein n=1 Tax=Elysia crispata TaxID=231223 RepID=A0AAE1E9R3_9GAST|nr:hypothetical protein RRG08_059650 [Elysia crispata]